jgi:hypothetical protein
MSKEYYTGNVTGIVSDVKDRELDHIDWEHELEGSNHDYFIRPTITLTEHGEPHARYGVFNRATGVQEAEAYQIVMARAWAEKLAEALNKKETTKPNVVEFPQSDTVQ